MNQQNQLAVGAQRDEKGRLLPGHANLNPGGRPKTLREIERMLDEEFRSLPKMRETYERLRELAHAGEDSAYMKLYLDRIQGPVRDLGSSASEPSEMSDAEIEAALAGN